MSFASLTQISSYDQHQEIRDFVKAALCSNPEIESMLRKGDPSRTVVVKPNWIQESHENEPDVWVPVITHPVVVLAVLEETAKMMQGRGTLTLCDAPHTYASFDAILARGGLDKSIEALRASWPELRIELIDLRREYWVRK